MTTAKIGRVVGLVVADGYNNLGAFRTNKTSTWFGMFHPIINCAVAASNLCGFAAFLACRCPPLAAGASLSRAFLGMSTPWL